MTSTQTGDLDPIAGGQNRRDRERLLELLTALNASEPQLRRDECGAWHITGRWGHINAMSASFHLVVFTDECDLDPDIKDDDSAHRSARRWGAAKERLSFCTVTQDGDEEGVLALDTLPNPEQADAIRTVLGIRKRREVSPEELDRIRSIGFKSGTR